MAVRQDDRLSATLCHQLRRGSGPLVSFLLQRADLAIEFAKHIAREGTEVEIERAQDQNVLEGGGIVDQDIGGR